MFNFIQKCISGEAIYHDIDDYIDMWHESDSELQIYEYLGMTSKEYEFYVEVHDSLPFIINAHRRNKNVTDLIEESAQLPLAARAGDTSTINELIEWLKNEKLWK